MRSAIEPSAFFVRNFAHGAGHACCSERTADGYVFRIDLSLRPDPASTPVALSAESALRYYESIGPRWERAALIKARPVSPATCRRHEIDRRGLARSSGADTLILRRLGDIHEMKRQMHAHRGRGEFAVEGHNIKLGRGGIREIEFFVQTQQ